VPRDDVAAVLAALLHEPRTAGRILELISGSTPIEEAVRAVVGG
ncbi:NAD-dependent dehydratase, partial [Streptomyces sp. NPDC005499]